MQFTNVSYKIFEKLYIICPNTYKKYFNYFGNEICVFQETAVLILNNNFYSKK